MFECLNVGMFECWTVGLEGLGGLESLEGKGTREKIRGRREKMSILELELSPRTNRLLLLMDNALAKGEGDRFSPIGDAEFVVDRRYMFFDCYFRKSEKAGDFRIGKTLRDKRDYFKMVIVQRKGFFAAGLGHCFPA